MLKSVKIADRTLDVPIVQGGMGVGISLSGLAGAVAAQGGMGVISAAHPGYNYPGFWQESTAINRQAIIDHVKKAKQTANGKGMVAVNIMVAGREYDNMVQAAIDAGADAIISGAGLPLSLPRLAQGADILLAPIVSSGKAIRLITSAWDRRHKTAPDFVVVEGSQAGGHLGFKKEDLLSDSCETLEEILPQVQKELQPCREKYGKKIPVFVGGGVFTGADIAHFINLGADGVQIGTRFIATEECDADIRFKQAVVDCKKEDIAIVQSPTGFPGRAVMNDFMKAVKRRGNISVQNCLACLTPCKPQDTPYCISRALIQAAKGNIEKGLVFVGSNAWRITEITTVKQLMDELITDADKALQES